MPIWTFDLPDDVQPSLVLDLSTLSVVTAPGTGSAITVEADESLTPLLDVTADGAKVSIRQIALVGRERFAGIWPWGSQTSRVRVTVPHGTRLDARLDAGSISAEHSWDHVRIRTSAGSIRLGDCMSAQVHADAGSIVIGALHEGSVRAQAGSVRIRSTSAQCLPTRRPARSRSSRPVKDPWICPVRWEPCRWECLRELRSWPTATPTSVESPPTCRARTTPMPSNDASSCGPAPRWGPCGCAGPEHPPMRQPDGGVGEE